MMDLRERNRWFAKNFEAGSVINLRKYFDVARNIRNEEIKAAGARGGVVGVNGKEGGNHFDHVPTAKSDWLVQRNPHSTGVGCLNSTSTRLNPSLYNKTRT